MIEGYLLYGYYIFAQGIENEREDLEEPMCDYGEVEQDYPDICENCDEDPETCNRDPDECVSEQAADDYEARREL